MRTKIQKAADRGHANHGWLNTHHSFSFANYYDPEKIHFGMLRVLNDDEIAGGTGFGTHPHENMEIISIPLRGSLKHEDSAGNAFEIKTNDVQVMSAGTGIYHSEKNGSDKDSAAFLQIWIFPKVKGVEPRYEQKTFDPVNRQNKWQLLVNPDRSNGSLFIHQDAYLSRTHLKAGNSLDYTWHRKSNGAFFFVIDGQAKIANENLEKRDSLEISEAEQVEVEAVQDLDLLVIEVPMGY